MIMLVFYMKENQILIKSRAKQEENIIKINYKLIYYSVINNHQKMGS